MKANRLVLLAVAGVSVLSLATGCAPAGDVAVKVGDASVAKSDVEFLTRLQCDGIAKAAQDPAQGGQAQKYPLQLVRGSMVTLLAETEVDKQLVARDNIAADPSLIKTQMSQYDGMFALAPKADQRRYRQMFEAYFTARYQLLQLAVKELAKQGVVQPVEQQVQATAIDLRDKYFKSIKVEVDPAYGVKSDLSGALADSSLSIPRSVFAKQSVAEQPDQGFVDALPAKQRCG